MQRGCRNPFVMLILIKCTVASQYNIDTPSSRRTTALRQGDTQDTQSLFSCKEQRKQQCNIHVDISCA
jgi:hypothetical protein